MAVEPELLELMNDTMIWEAATKVSGRGGTKSHAAPVSIRGYFDERLIRRYNSDGDVIGVGQQFIAGDMYAIDPGDKVTMPNGKSPQIVGVQPLRDENGLGYSVVITVGG